MARESALLGALSSQPVSTTDLYDRVGYVTLTRLGLVPYTAFRAELARLSASGRVRSCAAGDGSTLWRLTDPGEPGDGGAAG